MLGVFHIENVPWIHILGDGIDNVVGNPATKDVPGHVRQNHGEQRVIVLLAALPAVFVCGQAPGARHRDLHGGRLLWLFHRLSCSRMVGSGPGP